MIAAVRTDRERQLLQRLRNLILTLELNIADFEVADGCDDLKGTVTEARSIARLGEMVGAAIDGYERTAR